MRSILSRSNGIPLNAVSSVRVYVLQRPIDPQSLAELHHYISRMSDFGGEADMRRVVLACYQLPA